MPYYTNNTLGTVSYKPKGFFEEGALLTEDTAQLGSLAIIKDFDIELGPNERCIGQVNLWYDSDDTSEIEFKFGNLNATGNAIAGSTFAYTGTAIITSAVNTTDSTPAAGVEGITVLSTDGDGPIIRFDTNAGDVDIHWVKIEFNVLNSTSTKSTFALSIGEKADGDFHLLAGSYSNYKKY